MNPRWARCFTDQLTNLHPACTGMCAITAVLFGVVEFELRRLESQLTQLDSGRVRLESQLTVLETWVKSTQAQTQECPQYPLQ